jgi:hypothetical protein
VNRYFALRAHIGVDPHTGEPEPLVMESLVLGHLRMVDGHPHAWQEVIRLRPVEQGGRVVRTDRADVADALIEGGKWVECDPPESVRPRRPRSTVVTIAKEA